MSIHNAINVLFTKHGRFVKLNACGKNYLHKSSTGKLTVRLVRLTVINVLLLTLHHLKRLHKLIYKLKRILKRSCASYLEKHRKFIKLGIIRKVCEVILIYVIGFGDKRKVNSKSLSFYIDSRALRTSLCKGFVIPARSRLDSLIGKKVILKSGIVSLNVVCRLDKS